jgi:hypothetical protein
MDDSSPRRDAGFYIKIGAAGLAGLALLGCLWSAGCHLMHSNDSTGTAFGPPPTPAPVAVRSWQYIVVHHSASEKGCAASFDKWHREHNHWKCLGYHFVIGNGTESGDGQIEEGPHWKDQTAGTHCKGTTGYFNQHGIGICLVGDFVKKPPTPAQLASLHRLLQKLSAEYHIPAANILGHREAAMRDGTLAASVTLCPGKLLDMNKVRAMVQ